MNDPSSQPGAPSNGPHAQSSLSREPTPAHPVLRTLVSIPAALRFYSKLPLPVLAFEPKPLPLLPPPAAVAIAGALLGCIGGLVFAAATTLGLPPLLASGLTILALVILTGALHEDGLADTVDGLGGGWTREQRLEIMRDSRIGTYGACAVVLSLILRVAALSAIASHYGLFTAVAALIATGALSRVAGLIPLWRLNPARNDGAGAGAERPENTSMLVGLSLALTIAAAALASSDASLVSATLALCLTVAASAFVTWRAKVKIGGFTGDIAGAAQQAAEVTLVLALCINTA